MVTQGRVIHSGIYQEYKNKHRDNFDGKNFVITGYRRL